MVASLVLDPDTDSLALTSDDDSDSESLDTETTETQTTPAAGETSKQSANLESRLKDLEQQLADAKQWEARFKGTQPVIQRTSEEAKRLKAEKDVLEARLTQLQISLLPEDQQQQAITTYQSQIQTRQVQEQYQQLEEQRRQESAVVDEVLRGVVLSSMAQQYARYGVKQADLEDFTDPLSAEKYCKKVAELYDKQSASAKKQQRRETQADSFEGSTTAPIQAKEPETMDEANQLFAAAMRQRFRNRR